VPLLDFTTLKNWDWQYDLFPFVCEKDPEGLSIDEAYRPPQAKYCNVEVDPHCYIGCEPGPRKPSCVENPNYVPPQSQPEPTVGQ
jgi:hypothetical protein